MQIVSTLQFKRLVRAKRVSSDIAVRKQMIAPFEELDEPRALAWTISTGVVDREQDSIAVAGWDLANFVKNPVVLWGHDASMLPIGRAYDVRVTDERLRAGVEFVSADMPVIGQWAEACYRMAKSGFLSATSVGFRPTKWSYTEDPERGADEWFPGIDFHEQELVELSVVTVPANPEALLEPPGEGTAIASDTPEELHEEVTAFNEEQAKARARRRRALQLAVVRYRASAYAG